MMTYALAPAPKQYYYDQEGRPAIGGKIFTFEATNHTVPKPVFSDPGGTFPYINGVPLEANGGTPVPIYWDTTSPGLYYVKALDNQGRKIFDIDNYPISGGGGVTPITQTIDIENHLINGQFHFIDDNTTGNSINPVPVGQTRMAPASGLFKDSTGNFVERLGNITSQWLIDKQGGAGAIDFARFVPVVDIGLDLPNAPSSNAPHYFQYELNGAGAAFPLLAFTCVIPDVTTFSGETLTISFDCNSNTTSAPTNVEIVQVFGEGGGDVAIGTAAGFTFPDGGWERKSVQINVPTVAGKNIGTVGNDSVYIRFHIPANTIGQFDLTNLQLQIGTFAVPTFIYQTYAQTQYKIILDLLKSVAGLTGDVKFSANATLRSGWILIANDVQTIGTVASLATFAGQEMLDLYELWWFSYPDSICTVAGGRGASPLADFNANKTMTIANYSSRVFAAAGNATPFGGFVGESTHTLVIAETPVHHHLVGYNQAGRSDGGDPFQFPVNYPGTAVNTETSPVGGDLPHNNMQPTTYLYCFVKL